MLNDVLLNSYHFINFSGNKHSWTPTKLLLNDLEGIKKIITCEWKVCNEIWPATVSSFVCAQLVNPGATDETLSACVNKTVCAAASPLWHTQPQCVTAVITEIILCIKHDTYISTSMRLDSLAAWHCTHAFSLSGSESLWTEQQDWVSSGPCIYH